MSIAEGMYRSRAELYDLVYHWKDYAAEAERVRGWLSARGVPAGARLLDAACGTGSHLAAFAADYRVSGFDLSPELVALARQKVPSAALFVADLASFSVPEPFDAITCMFGAIGYVHPLERLASAAACFARALRPGGVLVLEPFIAPEQLVIGRPSMQTYDTPSLKVCRTSVSRRVGELVALDFAWLVQREAAPAEHFVETHHLAALSRDELARVLEGAGLEVSFEAGLADARGTLIGVRR